MYREGSPMNTRSTSKAYRTAPPQRFVEDYSVRETGVVIAVKEMYGFIRCADRPAEIFFQYSEVSNVHPDHLQLDDEVKRRQELPENKNKFVESFLGH